jgi:hypothetical protein
MNKLDLKELLKSADELAEPSICVVRLKTNAYATKRGVYL